ncbi:MAG TPA: NAD(P)/FAD-dependent oxidoreductase, partial [Dehalococcoidales bacterium]|nr:NAD(P)/FAD-dependent oxidoreductase [Dehalococcoidales bacterium]
MDHDLFDVAVIGAGPIGSWTACRLASLGHRVVVLERQPAVGLKPCCTGIISRSCIEQFGVPDDVLYQKLNSAVAYSPSGESVRVSHPQYQAAIVDRSGFDNWLAGKAQSQGACYLLNHHVVSLQAGSDRVEIVFQNKESKGTL